MSDKFGYHPWTVEELVAGIDKGVIRLPDLQRPFVWPNSKVRDLIDSMYRGYPVGELMFWANREAEHSRPVGAGAAKTQDASFQIVDGQQRLTSMYAVVKGVKVWREDYSSQRIHVSFNPLTGRFEVPTAATRRSIEWIDDITTIFTDPIGARHSYLKKMREDVTRTVDEEFERLVEVGIQRVSQLNAYGFQVVQIKDAVPRETVADIFVRINSEGVSLSAADFILTWLSVFWEDGRDQLEKWSRNSRFSPGDASSRFDEQITWTPQNPYLSFEPGQILRVAVAVGLNRARLQDAYNALRGRDPRTREIHEDWREAELENLKRGHQQAVKPLHWDEFLRVLERAGFRTREMITSNTTIIYTYALWIIGRVRFGVPVDELREVMAQWFFMAQITGRYTGSAETRMQEDLNRLSDLPEPRQPDRFLNALASQIQAAVPADWWTVTLPDALITSSTKAPAFVAYIAALNVLDAEVLLSTSKVRDWVNPTRVLIKGIEKHHLFPKAYLDTKLGINTTVRVNQVANFALLEWSDNIDISDDAPAEYWPKQIADKRIDAARRTRQEEWHALPADWTRLDYDDFLAQRRKLMANVIRQGFLRLSDPSYEPDLAQPAPAAQAPRDLPSFEDLVQDGIVPPGTVLVPVDPERTTTAEVTEDALIRIGEHLHSTIDIAAKADGDDTGAGWDYWAARLDGAGEPVTLATLRTSGAIPRSCGCT